MNAMAFSVRAAHEQMLRLVRILLPAIAVLWLWSTSVDAATFIRFESEPGDYIGGGQVATFAAVSGAISSGGRGVTLSAGGYYFDLFAATGQLAVGAYEGATRYPFNRSEPGLSVYGNGRGCNQLTGRFIVYEIEMAADGTMSRFAADLEQHCEGGNPALFAFVRFNSDLPLTDGDNDSVLDIRDNCPAVANADQVDTDADGLGNVCDPVQGVTFVYLDSQTGDYIGGGRQYLFTPEDGGPIVAQAGGSGLVTINAGGFSYRFRSVGTAPLAVGAYEGATRYPFNSATEPGLSVSGNGRGCNTLTGRFEILEIRFDSQGGIEHFAADFEQHCEGGTPALFGIVRVNAETAGAGNFDGDGDGVVNPADNCPATANPAQVDGDGDDIGNACDPYPDSADNLGACLDERDGLYDVVESLTGTVQQLQLAVNRLEEKNEELQQSLVDSDNDGVVDGRDSCPQTTPPSVINASGCSRTQVCAAIDVSTPAGASQCLLAAFYPGEKACRLAKGIKGAASSSPVVSCVARWR